TRPGATIEVAGLSLAVRAVLALREAGFDEVALLAPEEPRGATDLLAQRGVSVSWIDARRRRSTPWPGFAAGATLLLAGDVLVDTVAAAGLREASPGLVSTVAGQVVGEVCVAGDVAACLDRTNTWGRCAASDDRAARPVTRIETGMLVPLAVA